MPSVAQTLALDRCPRCGIAKPHLSRQWSFNAPGPRHSATYHCSVCAGIILAMAVIENGEIVECWPPAISVSEHVPNPAREYLRQAQETLGQPAGSLMLCASGVDAMLKEKGRAKARGREGRSPHAGQCRTVPHLRPGACGVPFCAARQGHAGYRGDEGGEVEVAVEGSGGIRL
jgi:hypothetical protein